uniref:Uncharacterized protein n=1 Tax=Kalanchoe fedtschenkoi TaxID=63787 RepID=A0A7N0V573_KALFE
MDPRAPRQVQIHKLADQPATDQHQTNSKPVFTMKTNPAILISSQKPAYPQLGQDGQISSSIGSSKAVNKSQVWDCGSSLYDSFELNSFNRQLDSVIKASSRTLYLPHLPQRCVLPPTPETLIPVMTITKHQVVVPKKLGRVSKSVQKILKSVFGSSKSVNNCSTNNKDSFYVYDRSKSMRALTTIPEMQELGGYAKFSMDGATPVVRRSASERFTEGAFGVSCA